MANDQQTASHPVQCTHESDFAVLNRAIVEINENLTYMRELLTSNALLEERTVTLRKDVDDIRHDVDKLKISEAKFTGSNVWVEKAIWAVLSLGIGVLLMKGGSPLGGI
jgi:hypothetical protein